MELLVFVDYCAITSKLDYRLCDTIIIMSTNYRSWHRKWRSSQGTWQRKLRAD